MAVLFLDTSALVRRYFQPEAGANRVRQVCTPSQGHSIVVARIAAVEVAAALRRRLRERTLTRAGLERRWRQFDADWRNQYQVALPTEAVHMSATTLVARYPLRTLDALQLASALAVGARVSPDAFQFWTSDEQQARAARGEGLRVELLK